MRACAKPRSAPSDTEYALQVQQWAVRVPIGLGLCPWAGKAHYQGRLRFVTCTGNAPADVIRVIAREAAILTGADAPPLSSTLVVCPHVAAWKEFGAFEDWVRSGINEESTEGEGESTRTGESIGELLSFVPFHPEFVRWRGLPEGIGVGSVVNSYWGAFGRKSARTAPATVVDAGNKVFGRRKVKVRFHESVEGRPDEQFVPIGWFDHTLSGLPLPDNAMHRAPYPTIHLIRNKDLATPVELVLEHLHFSSTT